jgi:hypothetical protein
MDNQTFVDETEELYALEEPESEALRLEKLRDAAAPIVSRLSKLAGDVVSKRAEVETRWLEDMCQYAGVRSVQELSGTKGDRAASTSPTGAASGSQVFVNITRPKTNRTEGRICDILFPADDKNWGIQATPVPDLATVAKRGMQEAERAAEDATRLEGLNDPHAKNAEGLGKVELLEKAEDLGTQAAEAQAKIDEAGRRAELMEAQIDDQLVECQYSQKARDAIGWAVKIGIGVLKGPVLCDYGRGRWQKGDAGFALAPQEGADRAPGVECTSPWAFFPDPSATCIADAEYVLERHLPSKRELRIMARKMGFDPVVVGELLEGGSDRGSADDLRFLADIRLLTGETTPIEGRFVVWEYHGQLDVQEIAALIRAEGTEEADQRAAEFEEDENPLDDRMVIAWFCNGRLLKLTEYYPMDSGELLYSVFSFEKGNASILGAIGVPRMMRDSQEALNAAWRMMMDNAALSTGPQILVDKTAVAPADGDWTMRPRKVWQWDSNNGSGGQAPFQAFNITMNQEQLAGIIALAQAFIDEETSMPRVAEGGGNMENSPGVMPVGTMAMLMNSAGVNIRRVVKNWDDDVTSPIITRIYDHNMQFSSRDEIKGDMKVEARGTAVLLVREQQAQILLPLAQNWTGHPVLSGMLKQHGYGAARMALQTLGIDPADVLLTADEYVKAVDGQQSQAAEGAPEDPQWQIRLQIAQLDAQTRLQIAEKEHEREMMQLSAASQQSLERINADLEKIRLQNESKERALAVEVAAEERNKRDAEAVGREPTGSGGAISLGSKEA